MAKNFLVPINLNKQSIIAAAIENLSVAPAGPVTGQIYYDDVIGALMVRNPSVWISTDAALVPNGHIPNSKLATAPITAVNITAPLTSTGGLTPTLGVSAASTGAAGTMSAADKTKLDGIAAGANVSPALASTAPAAVAAVSAVGVGTTSARADHVHAHGNQGGGTLHANATTSVDGFMSAADKTKIDGVAAGATANVGTVTNVTGTGAISVANGGTTPAISVAAATTAIPGTMSATDKVKLDGVTAGATANATDAFLLARANQTGTQSADTLTDGTTNKAFLATERTKLAGIAAGATVNQTDAYLLARANQTGTQTAATISNFDTQVRTSALNLMAVPAAAVNFNSQKITNLGAPTAASNDAARMIDVENAVQSAAAGIDAKQSARIASVGNLGLTGLVAIDGVTPVAGDRILVKNQTLPAANGIYTAAAGAWARAVTANQNGELTPGAFWYVEEGTVNAKTQWRIENSGAIVIGTTPITINQFGAATVFTAGDGIDITGNTVSVKVKAGGGILEDASGVYIDVATVARKFAANVGDGSATNYVITHNLNTRDVQVALYLNSGTYEEVEADIEHTTVNTVTVKFATAPGAAAYRAVVNG